MEPCNCTHCQSRIAALQDKLIVAEMLLARRDYFYSLAVALLQSLNWRAQNAQQDYTN